MTVLTSIDFERVREAVSAEDVARHIGLDVRNGKVICPFHADKTPSLSFRKGRFRCFGCGASGSSSDFASLYYEITTAEAVTKLAKDFGVPIEGVDSKLTKREQQVRRKEAEAWDVFSRWKDHTEAQLAACHRLAIKAQILGHDPTPQEIAALRDQVIIAYYLDILASGEIGENMQVFRQREEVDARCRRILGYMSTKSQTQSEGHR